jgi:hypothetical protein
VPVSNTFQSCNVSVQNPFRSSPIIFVARAVGLLNSDRTESSSASSEKQEKNPQWLTSRMAQVPVSRGDCAPFTLLLHGRVARDEC